MPIYAYEAKSPAGQVVRGEVEAGTLVEVRVKLRAMKLLPVKVKEKGVRLKMGNAKFSLFQPSVKSKDLQIFTRQFATLINSGIPIVQSLQILAGTTKSPLLKSSLEKVRSDVESGRRLADSMGQFPHVFDRLYINLVRAGEEGGVLDTILNRLASYIERSVKIVGKVKGAMWYPAAIMAVAALVISAIMIFVIPKFESMFATTNQELPLLTQWVVATSHAFGKYWYMIIGSAFGTIYVGVQYYKSDKGRIVCDRLFILLPLFGPLIQKSAIARFSRTLSTMLSSGVGVLEALEISGKTVGNAVMEATIINAKTVVQEGKSMVLAFSKDRNFPDMVVQMIGVGEQTGALDIMLAKIADFYEDEVETTVTALTSLLEPLMMVFLGGIIAIIVVAMYLPIFNLAGGIAGG